MKPLTALVLAVLLLGPAAAQERMPGKLGTLAQGYWSCGVPGSAEGAYRIGRGELDFETIRGSRYRVGEEVGTYLRLEDVVTITSGPFRGREFRVTGTNALRETENGADTDVRCLRRPPDP